MLPPTRHGVTMRDSLEKCEYCIIPIIHLREWSFKTLLIRIIQNEIQSC